KSYAGTQAAAGQGGSEESGQISPIVSPPDDRRFGQATLRGTMPPLPQATRTGRMNRRFLTPLFVILLVCQGAVAIDYSTPRGRVQDAISRVIAVLKDGSLDREARWERIAAVIDDSFDFRSMSQSVLATHWKR